MYTKTVVVTPEQAIEWLQGSVHNRTVRDAVVERYARDMTAGKWRLTHQGLAFDEHKTLIDGQHRLWAVTVANLPVTFMVTWGLPEETQAVIDDSLPRTMVDVLKLAYGRQDASTMQVAIAKRLGDTTHGRLTRQETVKLIEQHGEAIRFAIGAFPRSVRGITTAPLLTVIARASYSANQGLLTRFCQVLCEGRVAEPIEEVPLMLRNWLLERAPRSGGGAGHGVMVYGKAERALHAFLNDQLISNLYVASSELFPLPTEKPTRKDAINADRKIPRLVKVKKPPRKRGALKAAS